MRITNVRATVLSAVPEGGGVIFGIGDYSTFVSVLVEVTADNGLAGYGEALARRGPQMTKIAVENLLAPVLVGEDPRSIGKLWLGMMDRLRRWGHSRGVAVEAISGVDTALWDLVGKYENRPVSAMLYGVGRSEVPCYASSVYIAEQDVMVAEAVAQAEHGYDTIKIKIGRGRDQGSLMDDVEALTAIRAAVGPRVRLCIDANGEYDTATALQLVRHIEPLDIAWFEEPLPPDDRNGYLRLRELTRIPLARGETDFAVFDFRELVESRTVDVLQPDLGRCAGITGAWQVSALAYAANLALAPHSGFSGGLSQLAALQLSAASPALSRLEYMFIDNPVRDIFAVSYPQPVQGMLTVPQAPGLGLELDRQKIAEYAENAERVSHADEHPTQGAGWR